MTLAPRYLDLLDDWNAANTRARNAYYRDPTALGDLLAEEGDCSACRHGEHKRCTGVRRVHGRHGFYTCECHARQHVEESE